jgi:DNA-repair protein complementing XP-A cells
LTHNTHTAKAALRHKEADAIPSNARNLNNKRPLDITTSPTAPGPSSSKQEPLKRDSRLGKYFEYDLSKMVNTKGGFLVEDGQEVDGERIRKEKERERERVRQDLEPRK